MLLALNQTQPSITHNVDMRDFTFTPIAFDQLNDWQSENGKTYQRITKLIKECARTPFDGTGKPEPLKGDLKGYWSRRITDEHRLVYKVTDEAIIVIACKNHY